MIRPCPHGTAHVARQRMGLNPTPDAIGWTTRVMMAVRLILDGYVPDADPALTVRRLDRMDAAWRRPKRIIQATAAGQ